MPKDIPNFKVYGEGSSKAEERIMPSLDLRDWSSLSRTEKAITLQELKNRGWATSSKQMLATIANLNDDFLRLCPGKRLHAIKPTKDYHGYTNETDRQDAAERDFDDILLNESDSKIVLRMLTVLAKRHIDHTQLRWAKDAESDDKRDGYIEAA